MAYTNLAAIQPLVLETGFAFENSNPANFMTLDNIVMICDNIVVNGNYVKDSVFLTLQNLVMAPSTTIRIPIVVYSDDNYEIDILTINSDGEMSINNSFKNCTIHLNGICWQANSKYYTPEIGNIYNNYTSMIGNN